MTFDLRRKYTFSKMAASPQAGTLPTPKKKEESFLDKIGTLGRKKKAKEGYIFEK